MTMLSAHEQTAAALTGTPQSLRIAVIGPRGIPSNYSGVERIVEELFEIAASHGHLVTVYCRPEVLSTPTGRYKDMRLVRMPAPGGKHFQTLTHSFFSTLHAISRGDIFDGGKPFDIISYHTLAPGLFTPLARLAGIPAVNHVHGLDWQREKWRGVGSRVLRICERTLARNSTQVVGVNAEIISYFRNTYGVDARLLPNGVNRVSDDFTSNQNVLTQLGLIAGNYAVCVGRLVPEKRIGDIISAFMQIPGDMKLAFVGEGKHSVDYVRQIQKQASADPRIVFTGLQKGESLETLFRAARLYVTASELEGLPSSLLECMERRIPVIASEIVPHSHLLKNVPGYDWLFPVGDVQRLRELFLVAWADQAKCLRLANGGQEFVRNNYSWPVLADATLRKYQTIVERDWVRRA
jgi:glycosyltransferase involved in cell wall biosynthesis